MRFTTSDRRLKGSLAWAKSISVLLAFSMLVGASLGPDHPFSNSASDLNSNDYSQYVKSKSHHQSIPFPKNSDESEERFDSEDEIDAEWEIHALSGFSCAGTFLKSMVLSFVDRLLNVPLIPLYLLYHSWKNFLP